MTTVDRATWVIPGTLALFALVWVINIRPGSFLPGAPAPVAAAGVLDLRAWDIARGPVPLRGEWHFRAHGRGETLRRVPDLWYHDDAGAARGQGYGEYRLRVLLPPNAPLLALNIPTMATAMAVAVNGVAIAHAGVPYPDPLIARPAYVPQAVAIPMSAELEVVVAVSNWEYRNGGMWEPIQLGEREQVLRGRARAVESTYLMYIFLLCMAGTGLTIFLLRPRERSFLAFAAFCAAVALRVLSTGEYLITTRIPGIQFAAVIRLEYLSFMLAVPAGFLFFESLYPRTLGRRLKYALVAPYAISTVALPFLPIADLTGAVFLFYGLIFGGMAVVTTVMVTKVLSHRRTEDAVVISGGVALVLATTNDALHSSYVIESAAIVPITTAVFIGLLAILMARRLLRSFDRAEVLGAELQIVNQQLSKELHNRDVLIQEIHHRVKNSLQIVASIISLQTRRVTDEQTRTLFERMNTRIHAIGLVYEKLYEGSSVERLEIGAYVRSLVQLLGSAYASSDKTLQLEVPATPIMANLEFCVDLGLMLNELVSNAVKYGRTGGTCAITLAQSTPDVLSVTTRNPVAPDQPPIDAAAESGLGFKILLAVLKRSRGTLRATTDAGWAEVALTIPLPREQSPDLGQE